MWKSVPWPQVDRTTAEAHPQMGEAVVTHPFWAFGTLETSRNWELE